MIISVHMPKTAGTSFQLLLKNHFEDKMFNDYFDFPLNMPPWKRKLKVHQHMAKNHLKLYGNHFDSLECIHGHFLPYKYKCFYSNPENIFVTWLRDPIERLASHYYFWMKHETSKQVFHKKVIEEKWSLEKFLFSKELQNTYSIFLYKFPITNFNFVGFTESFEESCTFFCKEYLNINPKQIPHIQTNKEKPSKYITDKGLIHELKDFHKEDYKIMDLAREKFTLSQ